MRLWWRLNKDVMKDRGREQGVPLMKDSEGTVASDLKESANLLANYFASRSTISLTPEEDSGNYKPKENDKEVFVDSVDFNKTNVIKAINQMKRNKAPG